MPSVSIGYRHADHAGGRVRVPFTSPPGPLCGPAAGALDVTLVRLKDISGGYARLPASETLPFVDAHTKACVVGHPRGSGLQISLHDSALLDIDASESLVHYRTAAVITMRTRGSRSAPSAQH